MKKGYIIGLSIVGVAVLLRFVVKAQISYTAGLNSFSAKYASSHPEKRDAKTGNAIVPLLNVILDRDFSAVEKILI